jgi:hypothetical protein
MQKSDREMIEEMDAIMDAGTEAEHFAPVPAKASKNLSVTYALRLSPDEYMMFTEAARARNMTLADLMRSATRGALAGEIDVQKAAALDAVRMKARELAEALKEL